MNYEDRQTDSVLRMPYFEALVYFIKLPWQQQLNYSYHKHTFEKRTIAITYFLCEIDKVKWYTFETTAGTI